MSHRSHTSRPKTGLSSVVAAGLLLAATGLVAASASCKKAETTTSGVGGQGGQGTSIDDLSAREFYLQFVHTELDNTCGVCHRSSDGCVPPFMGKSGEDSYEILGNTEGIVTHGDNSNLIYHGAHTGPALTEFQEELVRQWLDKEFADDDAPPKPTLGEALVEIGNCMLESDFNDNKVYLLAYQQSDHGPCGSCHRTGEAGTWIGYNEEEMFAKNTRLPWIKRLVKPAYDENNRFNDLVPSNRFVDKVEQASACGSPHAAGSVPATMEDAINLFVSASLDRWRADACDP